MLTFRRKKHRPRILINVTRLTGYEDLVPEADERDEVDHMIQEILGGPASPQLEE